VISSDVSSTSDFYKGVQHVSNMDWYKKLLTLGFIGLDVWLVYSILVKLGFHWLFSAVVAAFALYLIFKAMSVAFDAMNCAEKEANKTKFKDANAVYKRLMLFAAAAAAMNFFMHVSDANEKVRLNAEPVKIAKADYLAAKENFDLHVSTMPVSKEELAKAAGKIADVDSRIKQAKVDANAENQKALADWNQALQSFFANPAYNSQNKQAWLKGKGNLTVGDLLTNECRIKLTNMSSVAEKYQPDCQTYLVDRPLSVSADLSALQRERQDYERQAQMLADYRRLQENVSDKNKVWVTEQENSDGSLVFLYPFEVAIALVGDAAGMDFLNMKYGSKLPVILLTIIFALVYWSLRSSLDLATYVQEHTESGVDSEKMADFRKEQWQEKQKNKQLMREVLTDFSKVVGGGYHAMSILTAFIGFAFCAAVFQKSIVYGFVTVAFFGLVIYALIQMQKKSNEQGGYESGGGGSGNNPKGPSPNRPPERQKPIKIPTLKKPVKINPNGFSGKSDTDGLATAESSNQIIAELESPKENPENSPERIIPEVEKSNLDYQQLMDELKSPNQTFGGDLQADETEKSSLDCQASVENKKVQHQRIVYDGVESVDDLAAWYQVLGVQEKSITDYHKQQAIVLDVLLCSESPLGLKKIREAAGQKSKQLGLSYSFSSQSGMQTLVKSLFERESPKIKSVLRGKSQQRWTLSDEAFEKVQAHIEKSEVEVVD